MQRLARAIVCVTAALAMASPAMAQQLIFSWENTTHGYFHSNPAGVPITPVHVDDVTNPLAVTDGDWAARVDTSVTTTFALPDTEDWSSTVANQLVGYDLLQLDFAIADPDSWPQSYQDVQMSIIVKAHDSNGDNYVYTEIPAGGWFRAKNGTVELDYATLAPELKTGRDEVKIEFRILRQGGFSGSVYIDNLRAVSSAGLTGDLNGDGFVGQDDLNIVLGAWGTNVTPGDPLAGDPSGDGFVGQDDLNDILSGWGQGTPPSGLSLIPEPASAALLALGGLATLRRRR